MHSGTPVQQQHSYIASSVCHLLFIHCLLAGDFAGKRISQHQKHKSEWCLQRIFVIRAHIRIADAEMLTEREMGGGKGAFPIKLIE